MLSGSCSSTSSAGHCQQNAIIFIVSNGPLYLAEYGHDTVYTPAALTLGRIHWTLLRSATLLQKTGYTFVETHPPFGTYEPTDLGKEVGRDEINWWLTRRETNIELLRTKTEVALGAAQKLKHAAGDLIKVQLPSSYDTLLGALRDFADSNQTEIETLHEYVTWLYNRHQLAPTILFTYRVWGSTKRSDRWPEIELDKPETIESIKMFSEIALGLRDRQSYTYDRVYYDIGAHIYESLSVEEQAMGSAVIDVPHDLAVQRTAWETLKECGTYFTELRDSLGNILLDIDSLAEQWSIIKSASFWREFIAASIKARGAEPQLWDFKETLTLWHTKGDAKAKAKVEFAEDVAAFANARGGVILVGIADQSRTVVGLGLGKDLENRLQTTAEVLKTYIEYDKDLASFEQIEVLDEDTQKLCLVIIVAQACELVGVTDNEGHFTYPVRLQTGKRRGSPSEIASTKMHIKSYNFDFIEDLVQFVRHSTLA